VSALSSAIAESRLERPEEELTSFIDEVRRERADLTGVLTGLGARPLPTQGNFVLAETDEADWMVAAAASLGVGLRRFAERLGLESTVRITVPGDPTDLERLVATLGATLAPEAIVFDLDGVLADVSRSQVLAIIETARSFGVEIGIEDIETAKAEGNSNDDWVLTRELCLRAGVEADLGEVTDRFETLYQGSEGTPGLKMAETSLVDPATWERWGARLPLGVVTGRPRTDAIEFLERFGLAGGLAALVTREDAPLKPDPGPVKLALETMGVSRAWMLGDTPDDLAASKGAGVVPIGVIAPGDDPKRARERLRAAARVLDQTTDLEEMLT
jgi:HAD superfamily hydrolase (TIGR01548 family)